MAVCFVDALRDTERNGIVAMVTSFSNKTSIRICVYLAHFVFSLTLGKHICLYVKCAILRMRFTLSYFNCDFMS